MYLKGLYGPCAVLEVVVTSQEMPAEHAPFVSGIETTSKVPKVLNRRQN